MINDERTMPKVIVAIVCLKLASGKVFYSIIPPRYQYVPIWRTHGSYRKQMKRDYLKPLYNQRNNKDETIMSVIKRLFGKHITSRR
jgi:hypothetical protein